MRRQRFIYEVPSIANRTAGQKQVHWRRVGQVWLDVLPLRGTSVFRPNPEESVVSYRVQLRFSPDIQVGGRFRRNQLALMIRAVEDIEMRHRRLNCLCEQILPTLGGYEDTLS
jgi:SPP1 family predicted phage head-tail adaptor